MRAGSEYGVEAHIGSSEAAHREYAALRGTSNPEPGTRLSVLVMHRGAASQPRMFVVQMAVRNNHLLRSQVTSAPITITAQDD